MIDEIYNTSPVSAYQPSKEVADFTSIVKKDFGSGWEILHRPWIELNNMNVIDRDSRDRRTFNAFVDENIEDTTQAWKWRGTRSKARNKAVAMHAQLTAGYIIPMFMAQNENSEEDRGFSDFMRDGIEWMIQNSEYRSSFMQTAMGMLVSPAVYMGAEYAEVTQTIKERQDSGEIITKEIMDEILSGFRAPVYSPDQVLISNVYEPNIQKHRFNIKRRYIEWSEAKAKYGNHEMWAFVQPGVKTLYNSDDAMFYDVKDDSHPFMVEEVIYRNRREDIEVCFLNGIYMGDSDPNKGNPIQHRDNKGAPKYNVQPFGYQRITEHFFYYKSLMNAMYWDDRLIDAQYELGMNTAFLNAEMPIAVTGQDTVSSDIRFPGAVTAFNSAETKVDRIFPQSDVGGIFQAMSVTEKSMSEGSVSDVMGGAMPDRGQKATGIAIAEENAKILIQGVGRNLAESMVGFGGLMADIFINHFSVAQVAELSGDNAKLKYRKLILKNKVVGGKEVSKVLNFDESLLGASMTEEEKRAKQLDMLKETGYPHNEVHLYNVNPELFARAKYLVSVEPERMFPQNEEFRQAMISNFYGQFAMNPYISLEALTQKAAYAFFRGESEDLLKKADPAQQMGPPGGGPMSPMGAQAMQKATANGMSTGTIGMA